jgi:FKBP12-rapamycin complex-associated protein
MLMTSRPVFLRIVTSVLRTVGDFSVAVQTKQLVHDMWNGRLKGVQRNVEVWQALMSVRQLMLAMYEDVPTWLKFTSLCLKTGRIR